MHTRKFAQASFGTESSTVIKPISFQYESLNCLNTESLKKISGDAGFGTFNKTLRIRIRSDKRFLQFWGN